MPGRVLVTGASGLIGRPAVRALKDAGYHVIAASRAARVAGADESCTVDLTDDEARRGAVRAARADHLVHLAWHDSPTDRWNTPQNARWSEITRALAAEFAAAGGQRMVAMGSCAEYDWSQDVLHEDSALAPASGYGRAKAETGRALLDTARDLGISVVWARLFFCYGPGEPRGRLLGDLLHGLFDNQSVACTDGRQERDFLHTKDVAKALVTILQSDARGVMNIGSGVATTVRDLIETTAQLMGRRQLVRLGEIRRPPDDPPRLVADVSRLAALGFQPDFDLRTGLQDCIDAYRQEGGA